MPMRTPAAAAFARFVANAGSIIDWLSVALMIAKSTRVATVGQSIVSCHFETSIPVTSQAPPRAPGAVATVAVREPASSARPSTIAGKRERMRPG